MTDDLLDIQPGYETSLRVEVDPLEEMYERLRSAERQLADLQAQVAALAREEIQEAKGVQGD